MFCCLYMHVSNSHQIIDSVNLHRFFVRHLSQLHNRNTDKWRLDRVRQAAAANQVWYIALPPSLYKTLSSVDWWLHPMVATSGSTLFCSIASTYTDLNPLGMMSIYIYMCTPTAHRDEHIYMHTINKCLLRQVEEAN